MRQRTIASGDVMLAVTEYGDRTAPPLIAVHGYPDNQRMWEPFAHHASASLRVITYDVRGAGRSSVPHHVHGYALDRLTGDLIAVLEEVSPRRPVHVLGHDWGSVQLWEAVMRERDDRRLRGRIASYTSISGPSLEQSATFLRTAAPAQRLRQLGRSWYVAAFHVPWIPELAWRRGRRMITRLLAAMERLPAESAWDADELGEDGAHGVNLYRANVWRRLRRPRQPPTRVPVQLIVPLRDRFVSQVLMDSAASYAEVLRRVEVDARHWLPRTHPEDLAGMVTSWALRHDRPSADV